MREKEEAERAKINRIPKTQQFEGKGIAVVAKKSTNEKPKEPMVHKRFINGKEVVVGNEMVGDQFRLKKEHQEYSIQNKQFSNLIEVVQTPRGR